MAPHGRATSRHRAGHRPDRSGKTTTLYASLTELATSEVNVCSIEDPIELIDGRFNQMQVQSNIVRYLSSCDTRAPCAYQQSYIGGRGLSVGPYVHELRIERPQESQGERRDANKEVCPGSSARDAGAATLTTAPRQRVWRHWSTG